MKQVELFIRGKLKDERVDWNNIREKEIQEIDDPKLPHTGVKEV